jgi:transposase
MLHARRNKVNGLYFSGRPTDLQTRTKVLDMYLQGKAFSEISKTTGLTARGARKICQHYENSGSLTPCPLNGSERSILTNNVIQHIEYYKTCKPSIYNKEIRENLINEEVCTEQNVPSLSSISKSIRNDLGYSFKKLSCIPVEKERHHAKQDQYIEAMMDINPINVHFFDECSVNKTTGNRTRGHSEIGKPAFEVQRYSSNATHTVNLLVGYFGIYCYDIIEGPSNGLCLLEFFNHAIHARDNENNPVLTPNDVVVMDNCGFHHAALVEPFLRDILAANGVSLVFQPPYSPECNVCELCFGHLKTVLRRNEKYSSNYTELAIADAISTITPTMCKHFFRHCGLE